MVVAGSGKTLHGYPQTLVIIELTVVLCATQSAWMAFDQGSVIRSGLRVLVAQSALVWREFQALFN